MMNPSSTLNKYAYSGNNPIKYIDPDGQDITIFYEAGNPLPGHTMLLAYNQQSGDSEVRSFGPDHTQASILATAVGLPVAGTDSYGFENIKSADDLRANFTSLTIQTTPEEFQRLNATVCYPILQTWRSGISLYAFLRIIPKNIPEEKIERIEPRTRIPIVATRHEVSRSQTCS